MWRSEGRVERREVKERGKVYVEGDGQRREAAKGKDEGEKGRS